MHMCVFDTGYIQYTDTQPRCELTCTKGYTQKWPPPCTTPLPSSWKTSCMLTQHTSPTRRTREGGGYNTMEKNIPHTLDHN